MAKKFSIQLSPDQEPIIVEAADQYSAYEKALQQFRQQSTSSVMQQPERTIPQELLSGAQKRLRQAGEGISGTMTSIGGALGIIPPEEVQRRQEQTQFNRSVFSPEYGRNEPTSMTEYVGGAGLDIAGMVGAGGLLRGAGTAIGSAAPKIGGALQYAGQSIMAPKTVPQAALGGATMAQTYPYANELERAVGTGAGAVVSGAIQPVTRALGLGPATDTQLSEAQQLSAKRAIEQGMQYTPAQMTGSRTGKLLEEGLKALPLSRGSFENLAQANQNVINKVAANAVGLSADTPITPQAMQSAFKSALDKYKSISDMPKTTLDVDFRNQIDTLIYDLNKVPQSQRSSAGVDKTIKVLQDYRKFTNRPIDGETMYQGLKALSDDIFKASKEGNVSAGAYKQLRSAFEDAIERQIQSGNVNVSPKIVDDFKQGRALLSNWFTVDEAFNPNTGMISGPKLATSLERKAGYGTRGTDLESVAMGSKAIPQALPSSGTTERAEAASFVKKAASLPMLIGGGAMGAATQDPYMAAIGAAAAEGIPYMASKAMTSEPVRSIVARRQLGAQAPNEGLLAQASRALEENIPADIRAQFGNLPRSILERMAIKGLLGE